MISKSKADDFQIVFPLLGLKNIEKVPFKRELNQDSEEIKIKINFIDE